MENTHTGHGIDYSGKTLFKMTWPIFIELLLQLLVGNMDQIQLSHFNDTAVAAVGNANQVISVIILMFNVTSLAAMILVSQYRGARDLRSVNQIYTLSLAVNLALSLVLAALLTLGADPILRIMHAPQETLAEARLYLQIAAAALPFQALMLTFSAFLRSSAKMTVIMTITALVNVGNIAGNAVLINGIGPFPRMGAAGAALSSSIFRVVGFLLMMWMFIRNVPDARLSMQLLKPFPGKLLRRLVSIGLPTGGESLSYNLSQMSCLVFVNMMGTYVVTTRVYAAMFASCIFMLISAVSQAGQILISYLVGARDLDGANACCKRILLMFCPLNIGIAVVMFLLSGPLFSLFSSDERVIALGQAVMLVEVFLEIGRSFNIVLVRNLQAVGDIKFPVLVGIASQWIIAVGAGYVLGVVCGWGLVGLWIAFALDENVRGLIFIVRWKSGKWRSMRTI